MTSKSSTSTQHRLLVVGGMHVDDIANPLQALQVGVSNPVRWEQRVGGVATNAARVAAKSVPTTLYAAVGEDAMAQALTNAFDSDAVTLRPCRINGKATGRYTVVLNPDGELHLGLSAVTLAEALTADWVLAHLTPEAAGLLVDANLSQDTLLNLTRHVGQNSSTRIIALPVSPARCIRLLPAAKYIDLLICNVSEARQLTDVESVSEMFPAFNKLHFQQVVVTDSGNPVTVLSDQGIHSIAVPRVQTIQQAVNGAGDALAGATVAAWIGGSSLVDAIEQCGIGAALDVLNGDWQAPVIS